MKLKCIGGDNDGEYHDAGELPRVGDCIRVWKKQDVSTILTLSPYDLEGHQKAATDTINYYIVDCLHFSKEDRFLFMRPKDWTSKQTIVYQFNK